MSSCTLKAARLLGSLIVFLLASSVFPCDAASPADSPSSSVSPAATPLPILAGGLVLPLYPPGSPLLNTARAREPEVFNMSKPVAGRVSSIVNIHNPSIELHTADPSLNTGTTVILAAGGGHSTLNVGSEAADFVPYFFNYGVNTVILRNRLRKDGYSVWHMAGSVHRLVSRLGVLAEARRGDQGAAGH